MMLREAGAETTWRRQVAVICSKAGQMSRLSYHSEAYPQNMDAYLADLSKAIGDIMIHCYIIAEQIGKPIEEIFDEAVISFRDEMANIVKKREVIQ
jgi:hypothetical protein